MTPEETLEVLKDLLEERGQSWVMQLVKERDYLYKMLSDQPLAGELSCHKYLFGTVHDPKCVRGILLRALGGAKEIQMQTDAAQEYAFALGRFATFTRSDDPSLEPAAVAAYNELRSARGWRDVGYYSLEVVESLLNRGMVKLTYDRRRMRALQDDERQYYMPPSRSAT